MKYLIAILSLIPAIAIAAPPSGIGGMAVSMMDPVTVFSDFLNTACILMGIIFFVASILKFMEHKRSPLMVPMSTVIFLFIASLVLLAIPLLTLVMPNAVPYTLLQ